MMMDEITADLIGIPKGNKSLAAAFKEIELVKEAFERSSRIESKILANETAICDIQSKVKILPSASYIDSKVEQLRSTIDVMVKAKLDEYTAHVMHEISRKVNEIEVKKALETKVNWVSFNELKNLYTSMKLKLDTHVDVEFENYKSRANEEIKKCQEKVIENQQATSSHLRSLYYKFEILEEKVQEVLADEDQSDYINESDNEFDKMLTDLEKNVIPNLADSSQPSKSMPDELQKPSSLKPVEIPVSAMKKPEVFMPMSRNQARKVTLKDSKSPLTGFVELPKEDRKSADLFHESFSIMNRKSNQDMYTRKSSVASTIGSGGIKKLGRKIAVIEKEIFELFDYMRCFSQKFVHIENETKGIFSQLENINNRCNSIEGFEKTMEQNFVSRLRIKDMQNQVKKNNVQFEKVPDDNLTKLSKEIGEKNKRIVQMENCLKYLLTEVEYLKHNQSTKLKDVKETLLTFERDKKIQDREVITLKNNLSNLEKISENLPQKNDEVHRNLNSASSINQNINLFAKPRRKSQDNVKIFKEERIRGSSIDLSKTLTYRTGATPKVLIGTKSYFS